MPQGINIKEHTELQRLNSRRRVNYFTQCGSAKKSKFNRKDLTKEIKSISRKTEDRIKVYNED